MTGRRTSQTTRTKARHQKKKPDNETCVHFCASVRSRSVWVRLWSLDTESPGPLQAPTGRARQAIPD